MKIAHDSELTTAHYALLARAVAQGCDGFQDNWQDLAIDDDCPYCGTTADSLASFDGSHWREARGREDFEIDGHKVIHWEQVQAHKGDRRASLTIIDLGGLRLFYQV